MPVKVKASVPPPTHHSTCTALTWHGLERVTRIGSRERGAGCGRRWTGTPGPAAHVRHKGRFGNRLGDSVGRVPLAPNLLRVLAFLPGSSDGLERDHFRLILSAGLQFSRSGASRSWHISEFFDQRLMQFNAFSYQ